MALDPTELVFRDHHEVLPGGEIVRMKNFNDFVKVMGEADFDRNEDINGYNRTSRHAVPVDPASTWQRNQEEHATGVRLWFEVNSYPTQPFSVDMSAILMVPREVPDSFGEDGPATV